MTTIAELYEDLKRQRKEYMAAAAAEWERTGALPLRILLRNEIRKELAAGTRKRAILSELGTSNYQTLYDLMNGKGMVELEKNEEVGSVDVRRTDNEIVFEFSKYVLEENVLTGTVEYVLEGTDWLPKNPTDPNTLVVEEAITKGTWTL